MSPNMNLIIPTPSECYGPAWAQDLNSSLSIIDQHTHAAGSGIAITQDAISLSSSAAPFDSLTFSGTNAFALRSARFTAQGSPLALATDVGCLYESGVDLYYNDGVGNQIRITASGSVSGSAGTITGLPSGTASAAYSAGTFTFQSATATAANIDGGSFIFRNATASSKGLTLSPPNAMASNYALVLPSLPGSTLIMQLDSSGNMTGSLAVDNSTLAITTNTLAVKAGGITTTQISASAAITGSQLSASASIVGTQLDAAAGIVGGQIASNVVLAGNGVTVGGKVPVASWAAGGVQNSLLAGVIEAGGSLLYGNGITVSAHSTGNYTLAWTAMTTVPSIVCTSWATKIASVASATSSGCIITTRSATVPGTVQDTRFSIIICGERP